MKSVLYDEGPDAVSMGIAGRFERGVPRELDDDTALLLLAKPMFREVKPKKSKSNDTED